jgi:hypothetical protein
LRSVSISLIRSAGVAAIGATFNVDPAAHDDDDAAAALLHLLPELEG